MASFAHRPPRHGRHGHRQGPRPDARGLPGIAALLAGRRIAAGTDEILHNIIAERVLGLPQDIRVDRELPFDELPTSKR